MCLFLCQFLSLHAPVSSLSTSPCISPPFSHTTHTARPRLPLGPVIAHTVLSRSFRAVQDPATALCFDLSVATVLRRTRTAAASSLFLVDTRPLAAYDRGHLARTQWHLDAKLVRQFLQGKTPFQHVLLWSVETAFCAGKYKFWTCAFVERRNGPAALLVWPTTRIRVFLVLLDDDILNTCVCLSAIDRFSFHCHLLLSLSASLLVCCTAHPRLRSLCSSSYSSGPSRPCHSFLSSLSSHSLYPSHFSSSFSFLSSSLLRPLTCSQMMDNASAFEAEMARLEEALSLPPSPPHVCLLGVDDGDALLRMVAARFLQRKMPHVSTVRGGYRALYTAIEERGSAQVDRLLEGRDVALSATPEGDPLMEVPVESVAVAPVAERGSRLARLLRKSGGAGSGGSLSGSRETLDAEGVSPGSSVAGSDAGAEAHAVRPES